MQGFEARNHDAQQLDDDGRGDVRHDTQREDRQLQHGAAGEQIDKSDEVLLVAGQRGHALLHDLVVHTRGRNERANAIDNDDEKNEEDLLPEFFRLQGLD